MPPMRLNVWPMPRPTRAGCGHRPAAPPAKHRYWCACYRGSYRDAACMQLVGTAAWHLRARLDTPPAATQENLDSNGLLSEATLGRWLPAGAGAGPPEAAASLAMMLEAYWVRPGTYAHPTQSSFSVGVCKPREFLN